MEDIMKIVKSLEDSGLLIKCVTKAIENETKEQMDRFLSMLSSTLGASLLKNMLVGKGAMRTGKANTPGRGVLRAGY